MNDIKSIDFVKARNVWVELLRRSREVESEIERLTKERDELYFRRSSMRLQVSQWLEDEVFV